MPFSVVTYATGYLRSVIDVGLAVNVNLLSLVKFKKLKRLRVHQSLLLFDG